MSHLRGLLAQIERLADCSPSIIRLQQAIVDIIAKKIDRYNWVGFYMLDSEDASVLVLGPFHGEPTPHVRIPVMRGICGAAVVLGQTVVVEDVAADPRYLACSVNTKSEIVTPIRVRSLIVGEIDVDSHTPNAFQSEDRKFLEQCAGVVGQYMERFIQSGCDHPYPRLHQQFPESSIQVPKPTYKGSTLKTWGTSLPVVTEWIPA